MYTNRKHLFFDMDDTVTLTRSPMEDDVYKLYASLPHDIIIVSGAHIAQISTQIRELPFFRLGQNGNQAVHSNGEVLWEEKLSEFHSDKIKNHIVAMKALCEHAVIDEDDLVEHRGAQISYSLIGHHEETPKKKSFDPQQTIRKSLLKKVPFDHDDLEVKIGGTTCFDYFEKGKNKGFNVQKLIEQMGWQKENAIYFGDSLFPGGNDETVIGVIDTVQVRDHRHTYDILAEHFGKNLL